MPVWSFPMTFIITTRETFEGSHYFTTFKMLLQMWLFISNKYMCKWWFHMLHCCYKVVVAIIFCMYTISNVNYLLCKIFMYIFIAVFKYFECLKNIRVKQKMEKAKQKVCCPPQIEKLRHNGGPSSFHTRIQVSVIVSKW